MMRQTSPYLQDNSKRFCFMLIANSMTSLCESARINCVVVVVVLSICKLYNSKSIDYVLDYFSTKISCQVSYCAIKT